MGCGTSARVCKIKKTAAIEILDRNELGKTDGKVSVVRFKHDGKKVELYYRVLKSSTSKKS
jgi:hypothetical protein